MNKKAIVPIVFVIITSMVVQAQQMKVEYKNKMDSLPELMQQYFQMQGVQHLHLTIKGDFNNKRAKMKKISCNNGVFKERELLPDFIHFILVDSIETLDFMAIPYGRDSLRITCFYPINNNTPLFTDTVRMDKMNILMETLTQGDEPDIPIIAYSSGIPFQGGTWFCGLRDSGVEPRRWNEKYGIDNYVYYTIMLEEDTPPNENTPIYVKIAKQGAYAMHKQ